ncbi:MAG: hypothetical protein IT454_06015 [Planctomycetes bacterium]|nr:hypothetical protein [Planctomycetota bacterium]
MKHAIALALCSAASATLLAPRQDLRFALPAGAKTEKHFTEVTKWSLESMEQEIDGQHAAVQVPAMSGVVERKLGVIDTLVALDARGPLRLEREFVNVSTGAELRFAAGPGSDDFTLPLTSALEGRRVVFERKPKEAEWTRTFAGEPEAQADVLSGLREDLDLRALVAEEGVEQGDTWKLDAATLADVLAPGGDLRFTFATRALPSSQFLDPTEIVGTTLCALADSTGELAGEILCTWRETKTIGDARCALIELEWESTARNDLAAELARRQESAGSEVLREDLAMQFSWSTEGKGQLLWNLDAKRAHSLELELDSDVAIDFKWVAVESTVAFHFDLTAKSALSASFESR